MKVNKKKPYIIITVFVVTISILLILKTPLFIEFLESQTFDIRFIIRGERDPGNEIAIVSIDDESLNKIGRWPWPRDKTADLIEAIVKGGAKVIGVDIIFSEPQITDGLKAFQDVRSLIEKQGQGNRDIIDYLKKREKESDADAKLAATLKKSGNIVLSYILDVPTVYDEFKENPVPERMFDYSFQIIKKRAFYKPVVADKAILSLTPFTDASKSMGHIYSHYERDGAIRWEPLYVKFGTSYFPSLGLETARIYLGYDRYDVTLNLGESIVMGDRFIHTDASGRALINFNGKVGSFATYPAIEVLDGRISKDALKDKIVLIGVTALGTTDIHTTPFAQMQGTEKIANVIENILNNHFLKKEEATKLLDISVIIGLGLVMALSLPGLKAQGGALLSVVLFLGYIAYSQYLFTAHGVWVTLLIPSFTILFLYSSLTLYHFFAEERKAKEIKNMFSSYVTEKVVNELIKNPEMVNIGGHRQEITVLFSDIRGFTSFSEMRTPEEVIQILNEYLSEMTDIVLRWGGTLDKFVGDEIMAFWGAPVKQENHAELAVRCALNMIKGVSQLKKKWISEGKEAFEIGIGINTGEVVVGNIGAKNKKMDYTIIGDHVNLGARVERLTRQYNAQILITEFTYKKIEKIIGDIKNPLGIDKKRENRLGGLRLGNLGAVKVRGKERSVTIYDLVSTKLPETKKK